MRAARAVARSHGLLSEDPVLISDSSSILLHLRPAPVVARVAATTAVVRPDGARAWSRREVEAAAYLADAGAPVAPPSRELPPGPHEHDGLTLTFWKFVDHDPDRPLDGAAVGNSLRELHDALRGYGGSLPTLTSIFQETGRLVGTLSSGGELSDPDAALLERVLHRLRQTIPGQALPSYRPLHGDAHEGNVLRTPDGPLWTDLEEVCLGPVEWDLACLMATSRIFGTGTEMVEGALAAYGSAVSEDALLPFFELRALQVAVWSVLMARDRPDKGRRAEARLRWWREREGSSRVGPG